MTHFPIVYLFLDFDGVVHPMFAGSRHQEWEKHPFCYLPELEAAIRRARQPVRIVIASTWRKKRDLDALRKPFGSVRVACWSLDFIGFSTRKNQRLT